MSVPDFSTYVNTLINETKHFIENVEKTPELATSVAITSLKNFNKDLAADTIIDTDKIKKKSNAQVQVLAFFVEKLFAYNELKLSTSLIDEANRLKEHFKLFSNEEHLKALLNKENSIRVSKDLQDEFIYLLNQKNKWAITQKKHLIEEKHSLGAKILWETSNEDPESFRELEKLLDEPFIQNELKQLLRSEEAQGENIKGVFQVLSRIIEKNDFAFIYPVIGDVLSEHSSAIVSKFFYEKLVNLDKFHLMEFFINQVVDEKEWAIDLFVLFFEKNKAKRFFSDHPLIIHCFAALKDPQVLCVVLSAVLVNWPMVNFRAELKNFITFQKSEILSRIYESALYYENEIRKSVNKQVNSLFNWEFATEHTRYKIYYQLLIRDASLLQYCLGGLKEELFVDEPTLDSCEKPKFILVGANEENLKGVKKIISYLGSNEVEVGSVLELIDEASATYKEVKELKSVEENMPTGTWVRDYVHLFKNTMRFPLFCNYSQYTDQKCKANRILRFAAYGTIVNDSLFDHNFLMSYSYFQLGMFESLPELLKQFNIQKKSTFQFSYMEGGNVLKGISQGSPYAIVGKDSLTITKELIRQDFARFGIKKTELGEWTISKPYDCDDLHLRELEIPDETVRELMALDLGLESADQVYFVEQPHYHLDVSLCILNEEEKIIALNDSEEACERSIMLSKQKRESSGEFLINKRDFEERIKNLKKTADQFKRYEEICHKDLKDQGFVVKRFGGICVDLLEENLKANQFNAFNHLRVRDSQNMFKVLALGGESIYEAIFKEFLSTEIANCASVEFIDLRTSQYLQNESAGIHCLTQVVS